MLLGRGSIAKQRLQLHLYVRLLSVDVRLHQLSQWPMPRCQTNEDLELERVSTKLANHTAWRTGSARTSVRSFACCADALDSLDQLQSAWHCGSHFDVFLGQHPQ